MLRFPIFFRAIDELFVVALVVVAIVLLVRWANRREGPPASPPPADEREVLNQLARQMEKMDRRLENLETILLEKEERRK